MRIKVFNFTQRPLVKNVRTAASMEYLDGEPYLGIVHQGSIKEASSSTVIFLDDASSTNNAYDNMLIKIVEGKGSGQVRIITSYDGTNKEAILDKEWDIIPDNSSKYKIVRRVVLIRGWDSRNDRNGDGWVDDNEFANLVNPKATARFRHQSRLVYTNAWWSGANWNVANVWNPNYRRYVAEYIRDIYQSSKRKGFYIDDITANGLGSQWINRHKATKPAVIKGGYIKEYTKGRVDEDSPTNEDWYLGYAELIREIKRISDLTWIGGNIANSNPYTNKWLKDYLHPIMDWYTCEDTLHNGWAVNGWGD
ncbi:MAG: hypothetical protein NZ822_02895 [Patescibacteria group bacterium]|nr:hypothetical protein [Patescibacteria group bacterium]